MDIPIKTSVECSDGPCGQSTLVIVNPVTQQVTHLVIKEKQSPHAERIVPLDQVVETTPNLIHLRCTRAKLHQMRLFTEIEYIQSEVPLFGSDEFLMQPYVISENLLISIKHRRIPPGELTVRRGARVEASDGRVGRVDEFLIDPANGHITHLVLREGHLWGKKDVTIPVSEIERFQEDVVYLKLDKHAVEQLPAIPLRRHYFWHDAPRPDKAKPEGESDAGQTAATIDALIAKLADRDAHNRGDARRALVAAGKPAVAPLLETVVDSSYHVRWEVVKALGQIGDPDAAEALVKALEDDKFDIRWLAAEGLVTIGPAGLPPLLQVLKERSDSAWLREGAHHVLRALATGDLSETISPVLAALEGVEPEVTTPRAAQSALKALGNEPD